MRFSHTSALQLGMFRGLCDCLYLSRGLIRCRLWAMANGLRRWATFTQWQVGWMWHSSFSGDCSDAESTAPPLAPFGRRASFMICRPAAPGSGATITAAFDPILSRRGGERVASNHPGDRSREICDGPRAATQATYRTRSIPWVCRSSAR
jgi:hypothetical protein